MSNPTRHAMSSLAALALFFIALPACGQNVYLLHITGISGELPVDRSLIAGLRAGGVDARIEIYDWTCGNPGLNALAAYARNQTEARKVADKITQEFRNKPAQKIYLTAHSGGNGIAVWALEKLPHDVEIDTLLLLAPALSPQYDLSAALRHVHHLAYVFSSLNDDIVLGSGTKLFGTMDRVKCAAAGMVGFTRPPAADIAQYAKLIPEPYKDQWIMYDNCGEHIGAMMPRFACYVLAPLLGGTPPATTQPARLENAASH